MKNAVIIEVSLKILGEKFLVIIGSNYFNSCVELILDECKKRMRCV